MVDFNAGETVAKSASEIEALLILEKRENFLMAKENCKKLLHKGMAIDTADIQSRLSVLFDQVEAMMYRKNRALWEELRIVTQAEEDKEFSELYEAFLKISHFLDDVKLTRIDNTERLGGNIIERNRAHGVPI